MDIVETGSWYLATSRADFLQLRPDWDRLFNANPRHSPFLSWGWVDAWLRHIAREHELQIIYFRDTDGIIQYILPLHRPTSKLGFRSRKVMLVCSYGLECSDSLGCICAPGLEDQSAEITASAIIQVLDRHDTISLGFLDSTGDFPARLKAAMQSGDWKIRIRSDAVCPIVGLPASWDEYLRKLSSNFRSQVRRSYKQVGGEGKPVFVSVDSSDAEAFADDLIRLNRSRMQTKGEQSSLENKAFQTFLREVIPYMAAHELAWMDVIVQDENILGSALNFVHGDTVYFYMGGFDDKARKIRPGTALFALVIQRGISRGYAAYDFLRGDEEYKYRWSATDAMTHNVAIYPRGFRGFVGSVTDNLYISTRKLLRFARELIKGHG